MLLSLSVPWICVTLVAIAIVVRGGFSPRVVVVRFSSCKTRKHWTARRQAAVQQAAWARCFGVLPMFHVVMVTESVVLEHEPEVTELDVKLG